MDAIRVAVRRWVDRSDAAGHQGTEGADGRLNISICGGHGPAGRPSVIVRGPLRPTDRRTD